MTTMKKKLTMKNKMKVKKGQPSDEKELIGQKIVIGNV